jgi:hypothetical protein
MSYFYTFNVGRIWLFMQSQGALIDDCRAAKANYVSELIHLTAGIV